MKRHSLAFLLFALVPLTMGVSCTGDQYRGGHNLMGVIELGPFPKQAQKVGGYNLYISAKKDGPYDKINSEPVLGGSRLMVPYLKPDTTYYFRMTSVSAADVSRESAPGQVFARIARHKTD